jgi:hypothetical protein
LLAFLERILLDDAGNIRPQYNDALQVEDACSVKDTNHMTDSTTNQQQPDTNTESNDNYQRDDGQIATRLDTPAQETVVSNPLKRKFDEANAENWLLEDENIDIGLYLPDQSVLAKIVDFFCVSFHHWIPYIHKQRLQTRVRQGVHSPEFDLVLHALVAVGMRHLSPSILCLDHTQIQQQIRTSRSIVENLAIQTVSVESLQALILIVFDHVSYPRIHSTQWPYIEFDLMSHQPGRNCDVTLKQRVLVGVAAR